MNKYCILFLSLIGFLSSCHKNDQNFKINNKNASLLNTELAFNYIKNGDKVRGKQKLVKALSLDPDSSKANALMGYFMEEVGEIEKAKFYYKKAISFAPDGSAELNSYALFLCRLGEFQQADKYFVKALKNINYANVADIYENAGLCALTNTNYTKAKFYFLKAWSHDPYKTNALYQLVSICKSEKNYSLALKYLEKNKLQNKEMLSLAIDIADKAGEHQVKSQYNNELQLLTKVAKNEYNRDFG